MQSSAFSAFIRCIFILILTLLLFSLTPLAQAADKNPSYDNIPITPKTWQEVDLSYHDIINGKSHPASIQLLRPIAWLERHGMHKVGNNVTLSIPEFGINAIHAQVTAIKPTRLNTSNIDWSTRDTRPVIGKFKRYAPVVKTYRFRNFSTGKVSIVHATPNHPFYVKNKHAFVPINKVSMHDDLVSDSGESIKLLCPYYKRSHCGQSYNKKPMPVYNLEVYQKHVYFVGTNNILVHNVCGKYSLNGDPKYPNNFSLRLYDNNEWKPDESGIYSYTTKEYLSQQDELTLLNWENAKPQNDAMNTAQIHASIIRDNHYDLYSLAYRNSQLICVLGLCDTNKGYAIIENITSNPLFFSPSLEDGVVKGYGKLTLYTAFLDYRRKFNFTGIFLLDGDTPYSGAIAQSLGMSRLSNNELRNIREWGILF